MAGTDPQKQFLTLIRGFASENSQGERRIVDLRKQIDELRSDIAAANAELEDAKRLKEITEQELKGYEVELSLSEASIQALEARIFSLQDEVSSSRLDVEALKNEEGALRDDLIKKMLKMNADIREFQKIVVYAFEGENYTGTCENEAGPRYDGGEDAEVAKKALEDKLAQIISQANTEEQEYQAEQTVHEQVQHELIELEKKVALIETILKENKELQELTRQISEFEQTCEALGNELQKRCLCPSCHLDNVEALGGILQASGGG